MTTRNPDTLGGWRLVRAGLLLLLLGVLSGFLIPVVASPTMALGAHLQTVLNAFMLVLLGLVWPRLRMHLGTSGLATTALIAGAYLIFVTQGVASVMGIGGTVFPIVDAGHVGTSLQELLVRIAAVTSSIVTIYGVAVAAWGGVRSSGL